MNPTIAELVRPHTPAVHVVPSGFDTERFPSDVQSPHRGAGEKKRIVFAGLVEELMKGFSILQQAGERLWRQRQDFEIVATADPPGQVNEWLRFVGWMPSIPTCGPRWGWRRRSPCGSASLVRIR